MFTCVYAYVFMYVFPRSSTKLEAVKLQYQQSRLTPISRFLNAIFQWKEIELFGQLVDSSARGSKEGTTWTTKEIFSISWDYDPLLLPGESHGRRSLEGCSPWGCWGSDTTERLHFHFHALEKEMATHSSVLAWRIPGMGEPGGLPSMGSHRVGHDWSDLAAAAAEIWKMRSLKLAFNIIF